MLVVIVLIVVLSNLYVAKANEANYVNNWQILELDPESTAQLVKEVEIYTPLLDENIEDVQGLIALKQSNDFFARDDYIATEASKLEREYIVQKGDTISGIANKFNMHVATIVDRNNIGVDGIEDLHPGQKLTIPPKDTSNSKDWLVALNDKKEKERIAAEKKRQKQLAVSYRSTVYRDTTPYRGSSSGSWGKPINYTYISRGIQRGHAGIDMIANTGTPVYASKSGKVTSKTTGWGSGYGYSLLLDHGSGQASRYAHLSSFVVGVGDYVSQGQVIGYSGNTGWSTGPHLHFEARQNGRPFEPW